MMHYRTMPRSGDQLSILGFGCMRLPMLDGQIDEQRAIAQIRYAIDRGVNYVDTAWPYHGGASEPLLAKALRDGYRKKVKVATKLPSWLVQTRADMDKYLDAQLQKLESSVIDYYLVHALNGKLWDNLVALGVIDFLDSARKEGRISNVGFSFHGTLPDFKKIIDTYEWDFCQIQYNFLDEEYQAGTEGLKYAAARDIGIIVMEPLRGGNLGNPTPPPAVADIWNEHDEKRSPAEWALRWVWNFPEVVVVLSGMNEESHIKENLAIAEKAQAGNLSEAELALVTRVGEMYRKLMKVNCTGCGYCIPCPANVMIPGCFEVYNKMHMFGDESTTKFVYALRMSGIISGGETGFASQCVECGECLEKCPQQIPIPDILAEVAAELEDAEFEVRLAKAKEMFSGH